MLSVGETGPSDKRARVCLLGATFNTGNMGVGALTAGTIRCLLNRYPEAEITLLDYGKENFVQEFAVQDKVIPIQFVGMRFSKRFYLKNNIAVLILLSLLLKLIPSRTLRQRLIAGNDCLRHLHQADLVASLAGGDSFSDTYGLGRLLYVALPQLLVLFSGKKLLLLPQTLGPFKGALAKVIGKYILTRAELVYSRDYAGLQQTQAWLGFPPSSGKLRFCYDVGFVVDPVVPAQLDLLGFLGRRDGTFVVGLNISGLLFMGGYSRNNMFGLRIEYDELIDRLIQFLIEKKKARVLLIPHVFADARNLESDSQVCERVYEALKAKYENKISLVRGPYNQSEVKYIIGLCDFFIGSRMHACIAAVSQNIPAVAIAYSDKFAGVMQTVGLEALVVDPRRMDKEEILALVDQAYEQRGSVRQQLAGTMPQVRESVLNLFYSSNGLCGPISSLPSDVRRADASPSPFTRESTVAPVKLKRARKRNDRLSD